MKRKCVICKKEINGHNTYSKYCSDKCLNVALRATNKEARVIEMQRLNFIEELKMEMLPPKHMRKKMRKKRRQLYCGTVMVDERGKMLM